MPGPTGPTGITGPYGLQGFRGPRGIPFGPTGPSYTSSGQVLKVATPTGSSLQLTEASFYTFYNMIISDNPFTVIFPVRSENFPIPENSGVFWVFKNNFTRILTLTFSNGTVDYNGTTNGTTIDIPYGNAITVMYGSNETSYIVC
jgi:hypothetical protein